MNPIITNMKVKLKKKKKKKVIPQPEMIPPPPPEKKQEISYYNLEAANRALRKLRYKDLQRECILRGMPFDQVVEGSQPKLASYLVREFDRPQDIHNLTRYSAWMEEQLIVRGYKKGDAMLSPSLRFGFTEKIEKAEGIKIVEKKEQEKAPKKEKVDKPKRVWDEALEVMTGTKKHLTYTLALAKVPLSEVITQVMAAFPEANEKSISIWYNKKRPKDAKKDKVKPKKG